MEILDVHICVVRSVPLYLCVIIKLMYQTKFSDYDFQTENSTHTQIHVRVNTFHNNGCVSYSFFSHFFATIMTNYRISKWIELMCGINSLILVYVSIDMMIICVSWTLAAGLERSLGLKSSLCWNEVRDRFLIEKHFYESCRFFRRSIFWCSIQFIGIHNQYI